MSCWMWFLVPLKAGRHSLQVAKMAKTGGDNLMPEKHAHNRFVAPTANQARSVLAARKTTALKVRSVSTGRAASKGESYPSSRLTRSNSATLPTVSTPQTTATSSSAPKKTTSVSASSLPLSSPLSVTRSSTPSRIHSRSAIPSVGKTRSAPNSRSSTPISRPPSNANLAATASSHSLTRTAESVTSGSSGGRSRRSVSGSRESSAQDSPPQTPPMVSMPRLRATITTKSTTARGNGGEHASKKASSGVSGTASGKSSSTDSSRSGRTVSKISLQTAIKHMDIQNGKSGRRPFSSTMLYPHSLRSSSALKAQSGSRQEAENREKCSGQDDGRSLAKAEGYDSARFDSLLLGKDVKDTNWLLSIDEPSSDSDQSLLFYDGFEPPPEPFPPL